MSCLLGQDTAVLRILEAVSEYSFERKRFDVLVLYQDGEDVFPAVVEVKVTSDEGPNQLENYLDRVAQSSFEAKMNTLLQQKKEALGQSEENPLRTSQVKIPSKTVVFLTVETPSISNDEVELRTFKEWRASLLANDVHCAERDLATSLLFDILEYLGHELVDEINLLESMDGETSVDELAKVLDSEFLLEKKLEDRVLEIFRRRFDQLNEECSAPYSHWCSFRGSGAVLEMGFYRERWTNRYTFSDGLRTQKFLIRQVIRIDLWNYASDDSGSFVNIRLQAEPYEAKKSLGSSLGADMEGFLGLRNSFADVMEELCLQHPAIDYSRNNYYLQVGRARVDLSSRRNLRGIADSLWASATAMGDVAEMALARLKASGSLFVPVESDDRNLAFKRDSA